jgi:hypothetical protein
MHQEFEKMCNMALKYREKKRYFGIALMRESGA